MNEQHQKIIEEVHSMILTTWPADDINTFFLSEWEGISLIAYHHTLGRWIRNKYSLWSIPWEPDIHEDGCDYSKFHPDCISQTIIAEVWKKGLK